MNNQTASKILYTSVMLIFAVIAGCNTSVKNAKESVATSDESFEQTDSTLTFFAIGDWGRNGEFKQAELASMMEDKATAMEPDFIISTGDNFYPDGVASIDDYRWIDSFEDIYKGHSLQCPWYAILGNHDYLGNIQAEIDYSIVSKRWNMPERYYAVDKEINDGTKITFVFIDSTPLDAKYYGLDKFKEQLHMQDTIKQIQWIDSVLTASDAKWKIVVGHHPIYSSGTSAVNKNVGHHIESLLKKHAVDIYLCGHDHYLQHAKTNNTHHIVSGAGSAVKKIEPNDFTVFAKSIQGFVSFKVKKSHIKIEMIDYKGSLIYSTDITK